MLAIAAALLGGLFLPLTLFPEWSRRILEWLPYPYLFWFPVEVLFGRIDSAGWARGLLVMTGWGLVMAVAGRGPWG